MQTLPLTEGRAGSGSKAGLYAAQRGGGQKFCNAGAWGVIYCLYIAMLAGFRVCVFTPPNTRFSSNWSVSVLNFLLSSP